MFPYARAYAYLLFAESRPASPAAVEPLDSLLTRLASAAIEFLASRRRQRPAPSAAPHPRAVSCSRETTATPARERLRPTA